MRWWGPAHTHFAMSDMQSLTLSIAASLCLVAAAGLAGWRYRRKMLNAGRQIRIQ